MTTEETQTLDQWKQRALNAEARIKDALIVLQDQAEKAKTRRMFTVDDDPEITIFLDGGEVDTTK